MSTSYRARRPAQWLIAFGLAMGWLVIAVQARGEDVVYLKPTTGGAVGSKVAGEVLDHSGQGLRITPAGGRERTIPARQVDRIVTKRSEEQQAGDELFARQDFREALVQYNRALEGDREPRAWVRRQLMAQIVWCQRNMGQTVAAGQHFLILADLDLQSPYFDALPLAWTELRPTDDVTTAAKEWLRSDRPVAALLGASLLVASDERASAIERLRQLSRDADPRIAWLAETQTWRASVDRAPAEELRHWSELIEASDEVLRAGPYFVLGSALAPKRPEDAALAFMKVPLLYPRERALSAASLLAAAKCLEALGRAEQAARLYREVISRYTGAPETVDAERRLQKLSNSPAKAP